MAGLKERVRGVIRDIPDFPKPGILFKDITPLLSTPSLMMETCDWLAFGHENVDAVLGMESRGFIFGTPVAERLNAAFVPARKKGKLPYATHQVDYALEYGTATLEIHVDAIEPGQRVLICDDLLATGGTAGAAINLVEKAGGVVCGCVFVIELDFIGGRQNIAVPIRSLIHY